MTCLHYFGGSETLDLGNQAEKAHFQPQNLFKGNCLIPCFEWALPKRVKTRQILPKGWIVVYLNWGC